MAAPKTVLFFPLNSPGHVNSSLGVADRLRDQFGLRTVFLLLGDQMGTTIQDHGHELLQVPEASPVEDFEISDSDDLSKPPDVEELRRKGRRRRQFSGVFKWPHLLLRMQYIFKQPPLKAFVDSLPVTEGYMVRELIDNHHNIERAIQDLRPDLVVVDAYYVPPCVVNLQVPWVRLFSANPLVLTQSRLPQGVKPAEFCAFKLYDKQTRNRMRLEEPQRWQAILDEWKQASETILKAAAACANDASANFLQQHNCPPLEPGKQAHDSPHLNIYMFPEALDYDQDDDLFYYPPRWFRCGSLLRNTLAKVDPVAVQHWAQLLEQAMVGKRQMVYFSLGSIASGDVRLMRRFVKMLSADTSRLYVVSKGAFGDKYQLNEANMIGGNFIPQTFFLERASAAIIHGGNNSVTECLYYGLPLVVAPVFCDQLDNGQRIEDLGLGRKLDVHNCNQESLLAAVEEVSASGPIRDKCAQLGAKLRADDDALKVAHMLRLLIERRHLDQDYIDLCRHASLDEVKAASEC